MHAEMALPWGLRQTRGGSNRLRAEIAGRWSAHLTRQDAQGFRPHVTIQNKTAAATAKALFEKLSTSFVPFEVLVTGLLL